MTDSDSAKAARKILKRDAVGRVRTSVRQREALMDQYERSGLTGPKFAEVAGVCYQTFAGWMQKRRRARGDHASSTVLAPAAQAGSGPALVRWVEAETKGCGDGTFSEPAREPEIRAAGSLVVIVPGGLRAELSHAAQIPLLVELARQLNAHREKSC
jgi:hypothetical protein